jgi:prevent-host-death family protein
MNRKSRSVNESRLGLMFPAAYAIIHTHMQQYKSVQQSGKDKLRREEMVRQAVITASEGHRAFGKLLKRVYNSDEHLIVERDGFPVAVMMSYQEYEKMARERALATHRRLVRAVGQEAERQGLTEEELFQELNDTRQEVFKERYGNLDQ